MEVNYAGKGSAKGNPHNEDATLFTVFIIDLGSQIVTAHLLPRGLLTPKFDRATWPVLKINMRHDA